MQIITVNSKDIGKRIDKIIAKNLENITRGQIIKMIKTADITVNNKKVKPSYLLKGGENIQINITKEKKDEILPNKNIDLNIIENNDNFIIINKQLGLQIHPSHIERKNTLVNVLLAKFPEILNVGEDKERPGIVHRLDKDTTGLLVVAKNQNAFEDLKKIFKNRLVQKTYYALVFGVFNNKKGIINAPIAKAMSYTKQKIAFGKYKGNSKEAKTEFKVVEEFVLPNGLNISLVELKPKTGRTHQIRVHMAYLGHPLLGDVRYYTKNEFRLNLEELKKYNINTFFLHAKELNFELNCQKYNFKIEYPKRFNNLLEYLDKFKK